MGGDHTGGAVLAGLGQQGLHYALGIQRVKGRRRFIGQHQLRCMGQGAGAAAVKWIRFIADYHDPAAGYGRIKDLLEIARKSPTDPDVRAQIDAALRSRYAGHPDLAAVLAQF